MTNTNVEKLIAESYITLIRHFIITARNHMKECSLRTHCTTISHLKAHLKIEVDLESKKLM